MMMMIIIIIIIIIIMKHWSKHPMSSLAIVPIWHFMSWKQIIMALFA